MELSRYAPVPEALALELVARHREEQERKGR
jgi:hypothetical protein